MPIQGTYLGTLEGVNHLDLIGWVNTARYKWAEIMGRELKFKPATFYLGITDHLARVVEGQGYEHHRVQGSEAGSSEDRSREGVSEGEEAGDERGRTSPREGSAETEEREEIRKEGERAEMADSLGKEGSLVSNLEESDERPEDDHLRRQS